MWPAHQDVGGRQVNVVSRTGNGYRSPFGLLNFVLSFGVLLTFHAAAGAGRRGSIESA